MWTAALFVVAAPDEGRKSRKLGENWHAKNVMTLARAPATEEIRMSRFVQVGQLMREDPSNSR